MPNSNIKKTSARLAVNEAVQSNLLPHISTIKCHDCGKQADHYHHEDYDKPLAVIPLCIQCHTNRHNGTQGNVFQPENIGEYNNDDPMSKKCKTLAQRAKYEIGRYGTILALSNELGVNPGVIYRVKKGGNSPTLRRIWKIPKHEPRPRLCIDVDSRETIALFDKLRGGFSRSEFLDELMASYMGFGEVV